MKKLILLSATLIVFVTSNLVAQVTPRKEFTVSLSEKNINLAPGESKTIDVSINRSKAYRKADASLMVDNTLPTGISITFADGVNPLVDRKMTITADEKSEGFSKTLILKAKINRVTKGVMFKLSTSEAALTSN